MSHQPSVQFLRDYIAIPSVNPMGRDDVPEGVAGERRYAEHVREQFGKCNTDHAKAAEELIDLQHQKHRSSAGRDDRRYGSPRRQPDAVVVCNRARVRGKIGIL